MWKELRFLRKATHCGKALAPRAREEDNSQLLQMWCRSEAQESRLIRCQLFCPFYQKGHSPTPERATRANVRNWRPRLWEPRGVPRCFTWVKLPKRRITLQSSSFHPFHITAHTELPHIGTVPWGDVHHCELPGSQLAALAAPGTEGIVSGPACNSSQRLSTWSLSVGKLT